LAVVRRSTYPQSSSSQFCSSASPVPAHPASRFQSATRTLHPVRLLGYSTSVPHLALEPSPPSALRSPGTEDRIPILRTLPPHPRAPRSLSPRSQSAAWRPPQSQSASSPIRHASGREDNVLPSLPSEAVRPSHAAERNRSQSQSQTPVPLSSP